MFRGNGHRPPERVSDAYKSLAELNEEWEDAPEEPKEYWYVADNGEIEKDTDDGGAYEERMKEIGNNFETEEEAEKAVEKLKAWKRLKDKGFRFDKWVWSAPENNIRGRINFTVMSYGAGASIDDLNLLFGGEE